MFKNKITAGAFIVAIFCLGYVSRIAFARFGQAQSVATESGLREVGKYNLISPLLTCSATENKDFNQYTPLESKIKQDIATETANGNVTDISVYFRDLRGAKWVGVNENEQYSPASLLKLPEMIAYYKEAEANPAILSNQLLYDGSFDANAAETFRSKDDIVPGWYAVNNLIKSMIVNSDNNATSLLDANINKNSEAEVYTDLGLSVPPDKGTTVNVISAKQYSYFFRILYNATYLNPEYSEKALELLADSEFPQGLRSTVPANVVVAQKFGERSIITPSGTILQAELHDCGIIYYPDKPYILCIMTRGRDFKVLLDTIQSIGKIVYNNIHTGI